MKQYVITISREFGALGRTVAQRLSQLLEVEFWDRDIVEAAAQRMGQSLPLISDVEERAKPSLFRHRREKMNLASYSISDEVFDTECSIIQDAVKQGSCIIVGRCSDYILREHPNRLSVYLFAPYEQRIKNCVERLGMDEKTARKRCTIWIWPALIITAGTAARQNPFWSIRICCSIPLALAWREPPS